ncbi:MAG: hypothetical protein ABTQ26_11420 [Azonexus sp.]
MQFWSMLIDDSECLRHLHTYGAIPASPLVAEFHSSIMIWHTAPRLGHFFDDSKNSVLGGRLEF